MRINRMICLFFTWIFLLFFGCSSSYKKNELKRPVTVDEIGHIPLGASTSDILTVFGPPGKEYDLDEKKARGWLYFDPRTQFQVALLSIDSATHKLDYKLVIPQEDDPENSMAYLLENRFIGVPFETIDFPRCGKDFFRAEALLVNYQKGVVIEFRKNFKTVEFISWSLPEDVKKKIDNILACKGQHGKEK